MNTSGGRKRRITKDRVLDVMKEADHAFLTTTEIVDRLPASRQAVNNRLDELVEKGEIETRLSSNIRFYWLPGRVADGPDKRVVGDELVLDLDDRLRDDLEEHASENDTTPEQAAIGVLADRLEDDTPHFWEESRTVGFLLSLAMVAYIVADSYLPPLAVQATLTLAAILMALFILSIGIMALHPITEPMATRLDEWRNSGE